MRFKNEMQSKNTSIELYKIILNTYLKGQNITHVIEQLEKTLQNSLFKDANVTEKHARVIGCRIPRNTGNSVTEIAKKRFVSKYHCRLKCLSSPGAETYPFKKSTNIA